MRAGFHLIICSISFIVSYSVCSHNSCIFCSFSLYIILLATC